MKRFGEIIFVLVLVHAVLGIKPIKKKNYEIQMDHLEIINSPNGNSFNFTTLRITKFNRTSYVVKANYVQLTESTSDIDIEIKFNLMQGNVYRQQACKFAKQPMCNFWKKEYQTYLYESLKNFSNLPEPNECPFPKREFWMKDYVFDENNPSFPPIIAHGKYRLDMLFYENNVKTGGCMFYFNVIKPGSA